MLAILFNLMFLIGSLSAYASEETTQELIYSVGMVNSSFAEGATTLTGENISAPASGAISSISGNFMWKFSPGINRSFFASLTFPLMANPTGSYFGAHAGVEFYFGNRAGSRMKMNNNGTTIKIKPGTTFFWGLEGGLGYLV